MARAERPRLYTERLPPIQVTPEMREALETAAEIYGLSMADLIREAIGAYQDAKWGNE
jgi:predicted DNA-binding protein